MTDIVERLRDVSRPPKTNWAMCLEAADEIERLTTERDRWQHDALGWSDRLTEAEAEVARLREQLAALQASSGYEASIAQVEIERLRAALQSIAELDVYHKDDNGTWIDVSKIARRALEQKT